MNPTEFVISRTFEAPRELVWKVCTDPEHMKHWWGPKGFAVRKLNMDLRPGGVFHYCLRSPEGLELWGKFVFRKIEAPERLEFITSFSDEHGAVTRHPMDPNWPLEMLSVFSFTEEGGQTTFTVRWSPYHATPVELKTFEEGFTSMKNGWGGTLDQLTEYLVPQVRKEMK